MGKKIIKFDDIPYEKIENLERKLKENSISSEEHLYEWLIKNPDMQIPYLYEFLNDNDESLFLSALEDVIEARRRANGAKAKNAKIKKINLTKKVSNVLSKNNKLYNLLKEVVDYNKSNTNELASNKSI